MTSTTDTKSLLDQLQDAGAIVTATRDILPDPCPWCTENPATMRIYGDPRADIFEPIEMTETCTTCVPWLLTRALNEQADASARPIKIEVQAA